MNTKMKESLRQLIKDVIQEELLQENIFGNLFRKKEDEIPSLVITPEGYYSINIYCELYKKEYNPETGDEVHRKITPDEATDMLHSRVSKSGVKPIKMYNGRVTGRTFDMRVIVKTYEEAKKLSRFR